MNPQTVYFLQAVWDTTEQKERTLEIARNSMLREMEYTLKGAFDTRTIYISPQAKEAFRKLGVLRERIERIHRPYDLMKLSGDFEQLTEQIMSMQMTTLKSLLSESGPVKSELHILAWQLSDLAVAKLKEQSLYQLYRFTVLKNTLPDNKLDLSCDKPMECLDIYLNKIQPYIDSMEETELDGRWAYERKSFLLRGLIRIDQFVRTDPSDAELSQPIGIAGIGSGKNGEFRIFGRGMITNLRPNDLHERDKIVRVMKSPKSYTGLPAVNSEPKVILDHVMKDMKYLIQPERYFEFINKVIIANTFHQRIMTGRCLYCGAPLYCNKCSQCGQKWEL